MNVGELIAEGRTSDVHAFGADAVIKIPRDGVPSHWAEIEAELSDAVHRHGLPAPEVRDAPSVDGRRCVVFERIDGPSMWEQACADPGRATVVVEQLIEVQRRIHSAGLPAGIPDLVARLSSKIDACDAISQTERAEARRVVAELPSGAALLHGDLHPGNVLVSDDGPIVIDWFDAAIGHPLADVVRTSLLMRAGSDVVEQPHLPGATAAMVATMYEAYLDGWRHEIMLDELTVARWEAVLAAARISEGADDEAALLQIWRSRPGAPNGAGA